MFKKLLFDIAKTPFMGKIVGTAFRYGSWAIPVKKVYNSKEILAFYHPRPSYENHIIISPKRAIKNLQQMELERYSKYFVIQSNAPFPITEKEKERYFRSVLHGIDLLDDDFDIVQRGYSLIYRCGNMQDSDKGAVFHVVSGRKTKDI